MNIVFSLLRECERLVDQFPGSQQVFKLGLHQAVDSVIWNHAKSNGFNLVTQDADFADMVALLRPPPDVIWLRCGNQSTETIEKLLRDRVDVITSFLKDKSLSCLEIF